MAGRLLALSDLHIGYPENRAYADALTPSDPDEVSVGYPREWRRRGASPPPPRVVLGPESAAFVPPDGFQKNGF